MTIVGGCLPERTRYEGRSQLLGSFTRADARDISRHMEDGCPKRFDIETLDLRSEDQGTLHSADSGLRAGSNRTASAVKTLPPMAASLAHSLGAGRYAETESRMQLPDRTWER